MRLLTILCAAPLIAALSACTNMIIEYPVLREIPKAGDDTALVYFFKAGSYYNRAKNYYVYVDGGFLGAVKEGSFFFTHLEPGVHNFSCLELKIEAGKTYYVENTLYQQSGFYVSNKPASRIHKLIEPRFTWVSPARAADTLPNLTYTIIRHNKKPRGKTGYYCESVSQPEAYPKSVTSSKDIY